MTDDDAFWAAKILMQLTPAHIQAAVDAARYTHPETVRYLVDTLIERQRKLGRYWLSRITPLDRFAVDLVGKKVRLCATDLLVAHRFEAKDTRHTSRGRSTTTAGHAVLLRGCGPMQEVGFVRARSSCREVMTAT